VRKLKVLVERLQHDVEKRIEIGRAIDAIVVPFSWMEQ
jgi:hypothetical protein